MEGPSLLIGRDEMSPAIGKKVLSVKGNSRQPIQTLKGQTLTEVGTWGKHLLLLFNDRIISHQQPQTARPAVDAQVFQYEDLHVQLLD